MKTLATHPVWSETWSERDILPVGSNLINSSRDIATDRPISSLSWSSNCSAIPLEKGATLVASRPSDGEVTASVYTINILISSLVLPYEAVSSRWSPWDHLLWSSDTDWKKFGLTFLIPLVATQSKAHVKSIILIKNLQRDPGRIRHRHINIIYIWRRISEKFSANNV